MRKILLQLAVGLAVLFVSTAAEASILAFQFNGSVSSCCGTDSSGVFAANFAVGNPVAGTFTFDTAAAEQGAPDPYLRFYDASFSITIGAHTFAGPAEFRIFNDAPGGADDGFSVINETGTYTHIAGPSLGPLVPSTLFIQFLGMPTGTLSNFDIVQNPDVLAPLANPFYAPHGLRLDNPDGTFGLLYFQIDSLQSVPEPASLLLTGFAVVALLCVRKRLSTTF